MKRTCTVLTAFLFVSAAFAFSPLTAAEACDPGIQENPGCCDRDPENGNLCCTEPTETQYVYPDGSYTCYDCDPDPTAPECCPEGTTWWEYPDGTHDCAPHFVVTPMPESTSATFGEGDACEDADWADGFVAWVTTDGQAARPRCVSQDASTDEVTLRFYYDTRYGAYGLALGPAMPGAQGTPGSPGNASTFAVSGYSGIGLDCETCPPPIILSADCVAYYMGECYALNTEQQAWTSRLPLIP